MSGAPTWVYGLLVALIVLGLRQLRTREVPVALAILPSIAFFLWTVVGAGQLAASAGVTSAVLSVLAGCVLGWLSTVAAPEPCATRLPGGRVRQPGSWMPLAVYLLVFVARFACETRAAMRPEQALLATAIGIAVSAAATTRLLLAVRRWKPVATQKEREAAST